MLPRAQAAVFSNIRTIKIGASLLCMSVGSWLAAVSPHDELDNTGYVRGGLGTGLIVVGWLIHPGTVGDQQVRPEDQRSLAGGMFHDTFGKKNNARHWTGGRMVSTLSLATLASSVTGDWSPVRGWVASAGSLMPYAADRAWGEFRMQRAHPFGGGTSMAGAWGANYLVGSVLDTSAAMAGLGVDFMLRSMLLPKGAPPEMTADAALLALLPMYFGTFAGQMVTGLIAAYDQRYPDSPAVREAWGNRYLSVGDSPRVRMFAHVARLGIRAVTRNELGIAYKDQTISIAADMISAFTTHRWPSSNANAFAGGLRMKEERAFLTPGGAQVNDGNVEMVTIHVQPITPAMTARMVQSSGVQPGAGRDTGMGTRHYREGPDMKHVPDQSGNISSSTTTSNSRTSSASSSPSGSRSNS